MEPVLIVVAALIIGEQIQAREWPTYIPIWLAVGLLTLDGIRHLRSGFEPHRAAA
ncbi:hypothetical protein D3C80_2230560 [compost metagenome]